jgi:hypothetical protein
MNFAEIADPIQHNPTLNPKLWQGNDRLKPEVRGALIRIAEDFKQFVDIEFTVVDVVITGSNVNYNYTNNNDLDLHLIADFDSVDCDREASELFDAKRLLYAEEHNIEVYDIPVGLYVEDQDHPGVSAGSYSILRDQWLNKPSKDQPKYDADEVMRMTQVWQTVIQHAMQTGDLQTCRNSLQLLRRYRKLGLQQPQGEFSTANLVYKVLRDDDTLAGITKLVDRLHDQKLSLK